MGPFPTTWFQRGIILLALGSFLFLGAQSLAHFETVDEHFWKYERIPEYWTALREGKWKKTAVNDKPGITVALFAGPGLLFSDPEKHRIRDDAATLGGELTIYDTRETRAMNLALRLPVLLVNAGLILLIAFLLLRIFGNAWVSVFGTLFIATSPILLGISQILNPDAFLWSFGTAAILAWLAYFKSFQGRYVVLAAVMLGFALLSKYTAHILFPFFLLLPLGLFLFGLFPLKRLRRTCFAFAALVLGAFAWFSLFLPAVFFKKNLLWKSTFGFWQEMGILVPFAAAFLLVGALAYAASGKGAETLQKRFAPLVPFTRFLGLVPLLFFVAILVCGLGSQPLIPLETHMLMAKNNGELSFPTIAAALPSSFQFIIKTMVELYPLVFSFSLPALFFLAWILVRTLWNKGDTEESRHQLFFVLAASWFALGFAAVTLSAGVLMNARYGILLFPLAYILAGLGAWDFVLFIKKVFPRAATEVLALALAALLLASGICTLAQAKPFYFNYTSPLLQKQFVIHDAWGYGLYEAAEYLNSLPEDQPIYVWSDRNGICQFLEHPKCVSGYRLDREKTPLKYMVVSKRGIERGYMPYWSGAAKETRIPIMDYVGIEARAVWRLDILGRPDNFIMVVPVE